MEKKEAVSRKIPKPGERYGNIIIIAENYEKYYKRYDCKCALCGNLFTSLAARIFQNQEYGCPDCMEKSKLARKLDELRKEYVGKKYGQLTISDILLKPFRNTNNSAYARCKCGCGNIVDIPLTKVLSGESTSCGHSTPDNLNKGHDIIKTSSVCGTSIMQIDGRRNLNKNSSTGHTGVSYMPSLGKYRAYINFQRKQYHLGCYEKLEDAVFARKQAEKHVYGEFLDWYASEHPEEWEKVNKKK